MSRARRAAPENQALLKAWQRIMAPTALAGKARRVALFATMALLILWVALDSQVPGLPIWLTFLSARSFGHLLAFGFGFWLALRAAAGTLQAIFDLKNPGEAQRHLWQAAFNGSYSTLAIRGGDLLWENERSPLARVGGPGLAKVHLENAALFEQMDGSARVIGPSAKASTLQGFERLRAVLDLRDQVLNMDLWARSKDGIRVRVQGARVVYSLARGKREASLQLPHPFEEQAALKLALEQRVERGIGKPNRGSLLAEQGQAFFERELQTFIGQFNLAELLGNREKMDSQLLLARDKIRADFNSSANMHAVEFGLQLHWVDIGTWMLDDSTRSLLAQQAPDISEEDSSRPIQQGRAEELRRLAEQVIPEENLSTDIGNITQSIAGALQNFKNIFEEIRGQSAELRGDQQLDAVLRFLSILTKRAGKQN
jgi:hypothetical protein